MNAQLLAMVSTKDANTRARYARQVQEQIDMAARTHLRLIERQTRLVEALMAAGIETIAVEGEDVIVSEMLREGE